MRFLPLTVALLVLVLAISLAYWVANTEARASHVLDYKIELVQCDNEENSSCTNLRMTVANTTDDTATLNYNDIGGGPSGSINNIKIYNNDGKSCDGRPYWVNRSVGNQSNNNRNSSADEIPAHTTYQAYLSCESTNLATKQPSIDNPSYVTIYGKRYDVS